jgi:pimeloyl-ACP methyl ester carboxylesterase
MYRNFFFILTFLIISFSSYAEEKLTIGKFNSRAIFNQANSPVCPAPLVIMVPGSGANGPEEMVPSDSTADGKEHSIFSSFSKGLQAGGLATLALGKPGIDFFKSWNGADWFYDKSMYKNLGWQDLINNLEDAVNYAKTLPCVDPDRIYVLGHSEGTQVAADYAKKFPLKIKGIILVGFSGENLETTTDWQLFRRPIDLFISPDIDRNHDNFISKDEAALFQDTFQWDFKSDEDKVSIIEIENYLRSIKKLQDQFLAFKNAKIWEGVFNRDPLYQDIASLSIDVYTFTGALDVQTRPEEALRLKKACEEAKKINCEVTLVEGLGHAMSKPAAPRGHKLLDATLGPVDESFITLLQKLSHNLF